MANLTREMIYDALDNNRFQLFGQPKWTFGQNTCDTYEVFADVLIGENGERYLPEEFLPIIELDPDLTVAFGSWFLEHAFRDVVRMTSELKLYLTLSINIFGYQADRPEFVDRVLEMAAITGIRLRNLQFELSERQPIGKTGIDNLNRLHDELGIRLVLDNFGKGYSNVDLLRSIPFDILELSREFTHDITKLEKELKIVVAIQQMAQVLDIAVCAKGIETAEQMELLEEAGFKMGQGFLIGRPMPMDELKEFVRKYAGAQKIKK
jgi:EAL domain-containing protein (putative c-di-GMP-specific phosphodiesterase class I)